LNALMVGDVAAYLYCACVSCCARYTRAVQICCYITNHKCIQ